MNKLRRDLLTTGWSMVEASKWVEHFNANWSFKSNVKIGDKRFAPDGTLIGRYDAYDLPPLMQEYADEQSELLHKALPKEKFSLSSAEARTIPAIKTAAKLHWHTDGGYFRVLLTCQGEGTIVFKKKDCEGTVISTADSIITPFGHALILTGDSRTYEIGMPKTSHSPPAYSKERRLIVLTFRGVSEI